MRRVWLALCVSVFMACCASPASDLAAVPQLRRSETQFLAARTHALAAFEKAECRTYFQKIMGRPTMDARAEFLRVEFQLTDIPWYMNKPSPEGNVLLGLHMCREGSDKVAALDPFWMNQSKPSAVAETMIHEFSHILTCIPGANKDARVRSEIQAQGAVLACFGSD